MNNHSINDVCTATNSVGEIMYFSAELMAWNSLWLIALAIAAFMVMIKRLHPTDDKKNWITKILFGGLGVTSLVGLLYPVEFGLIGVNIFATIILLVEFCKKESTT